MYYKKNPESHPEYSTEWKMFWERRYHELSSKGLNPNKHDFKSEWAGFWNDRMKDIFNNSVETRKEALMKKHKISKEDLEEKRPISPWEDSDEPRQSRAVESDFTVVGALNALIEVDSLIGAFGPAIRNLLHKSISCCSEGKKSIDIFKDSDNLTLVKLSLDKLSIRNTKESAMMYAKRQKGVECCKWLLDEIEKERTNKEEENFGIDIKELSIKTIGQNTVLIAQQIALALLKVGKSNVSEEYLQTILLAVSASHARIVMERQAKDKAVASELQVTSTTSSEDSKETTMTSSKSKPLFPAGASLPKVSVSTSSSSVQSTTSGLDIEVTNNELNKRFSVSEVEAKTSGALGQLISAYDDEPARDMEKLGLEDLVNLLSNFRDLNRDEQRALTTYLKRLEATDIKKVTKLRELVQKNVKANDKAKPKLDSDVQLPRKKDELEPKPRSPQKHDKRDFRNSRSRSPFARNVRKELERPPSRQSPFPNRPRSQLSNPDNLRQSPIPRSIHLDSRDDFREQPYSSARNDIFAPVTDTFAQLREPNSGPSRHHEERFNDRRLMERDIHMPMDRDGRLFDRDRRPLPHDVPLGRDGRPLSRNGPLLDRDGRPIQHGLIGHDGRPVRDPTMPERNLPRLDHDGRPLPRDMPMLDRDGRPLPREMPMLDRDGRPLPREMPLLDRDGRPLRDMPMLDRDVRPIRDMPMLDRDGRPLRVMPMLDRDGRHLSREMPMLDRDGRPLPREMPMLDRDGRPLPRDMPMLDRDGRHLPPGDHMVDCNMPIDQGGRPMPVDGYSHNLNRIHLGREGIHVNRDSNPIHFERYPVGREVHLPGDSLSNWPGPNRPISPSYLINRERGAIPALERNQYLDRVPGDIEGDRLRSLPGSRPPFNFSGGRPAERHNYPH